MVVSCDCVVYGAVMIRVTVVSVQVESVLLPSLFAPVSSGS